MKQKEIIQKVIVIRTINPETKKEDLKLELIGVDYYTTIGLIAKLLDNLITGKIQTPDQKQTVNYMG